MPQQLDPIPLVGVVGAGQLARMAHQATIGIATRPLRVLAASPEESAALVAGDVVIGDHRSLADLRSLAEGVDVVTFDHELVAPEDLATLEAEGHVLRPSASALRFAQDKRHQRETLSAAGIPVPTFAVLHAARDVEAFGDQHGWPVVVKTARGGYDGRGVWVVDDAAEARRLVDELLAGGAELLVEEHLDLAAEVAVGVVSDPDGRHRRWPVTETVQRDGICVELVVPARVPGDVLAAAEALADRVLDRVGAVGVMAVEAFVTADGRVLLNEVALRPHNSLHWTIEGAFTSQFQNHVRAVLGLPLGSVELMAPAVATVNVLGPADGSDPAVRLAAALEDDGVAVHLYGKSARPGRKLGHVTVLGDDVEDVLGRARTAAARLTGEEPSHE